MMSASSSLALACALVLVSCSLSECALIVDVNTTRLIDASGRERIFHGTNVVYKAYPYVPIIDHFDYQYSFSQDDVDLLVKWGVTAIRLGVMWPGVEPQQNQYNQTYLQILKNITAMCEANNIWVLLDMHQDTWSERFCGEGVPLWAAPPGSDIPAFPLPIDQPYSLDNATGVPSPQDCDKHSWTEYYFTAALGSSVQRLYDNQGGLLDAFCNFWALVASTFKDFSNILGYELINEPWAGDVNKQPELLIPGVADRKNLQNVYDRASAAIRAVDTKTPIFFETVTWDDVVVGFSHPPGGALYQNVSVLAYHYYAPPNLGPAETIEVHIKAANNLQCGTFCTETDSLHFPETADAYFQSWLHWEYKAFVPMTGSNFGFWNSNGTVNEDTVRSLTRTYATAIAGHGVNMSFNSTSGDFTLSYNIDTACSNPTTIYAYQALHYPLGLQISISPPVLSWSSSVENYFDFVPLQKATNGELVTITLLNRDPLAAASSDV
eukprot:m.22911 g.22911  ORF g.22911 m.22911 type:complete len:494 (-) comp9393_c0_seq2:215-1696(-)